MGRFKTKILLSFRTKVIVPVVVAMVVLMTISMWVVGHQVKRQIIESARQQLTRDEYAFKILDERNVQQLFLRYGNIKSDPLFQSASALIGPPARLATAPADAPSQKFLGFGRSPKPVDASPPPARDPERAERARDTLRGIFDEMIGDNVAEVITLSAPDGKPLTVTRDPQLDTAEFEQGCATAIRQVIEGQQRKFTRKMVGNRLYDIVSLPVQRGGVLAGVVTFGVSSSIVQDFKKVTTSDVALVANHHVVASTLTADLRRHLDRLLAENSVISSNTVTAGESDMSLGREEFSCLAGQLEHQNPLGYLIFSSRDKPLGELRATQQTILLVSLCAMLVGCTVVWMTMRRVVGPLEELRDTAEAIGSGDFSRRVEINSTDECGELARVFNQMTENLRHSRDELETTVERLKHTQAQLVQSEKLSGIGEFVAGVAHELNNPLTTVMGFSELLQEADVSKDHRSYLEMIFKSAQRCQKIVQALLGFARRHQPERKPYCVNKLIEASVEILQYQLRTSNIEVQLRLDPNLPLAMVDSHQLQQVFVNIINNGRQAIEGHRPKGWIRISTEVAGPNVHITIQDNGPGITPDNLSKIFDPFFSTKEVGQGTGLGLSLCYGIIKEHGGSIVAQSRRGEGACFVIELPITNVGETSPLPAPAETRPANPVSQSAGAGKKVLVIDDEEPILRMVCEILGRQGYQVDVASDGETGLRRLRQNQYDVTLCDWKMPGLNGRQVYEQARTISPAMSNRFVFITGDLVNDRTRKFLEAENKVCLPKPFSIAEFSAAISRVMV